MNCMRDIKTTSIQFALAVFFCAACLFPDDTSARNTIDTNTLNTSEFSSADTISSKPKNIIIAPSKVNLSDKLNYDLKPKGIIRKMIQPVKFKENRLAKEKEDIYRYLLELIKNEQLKIDTATVNQIMRQLDQIVESNQISNKLLKDSITNSLTANQKNTKKIDEIFSSLKIQNKANQSVIDSIKTQMGVFIQASEMKTSLEKRVILDEINRAIKPISEVKFSASSNLSKVEETKIDDNPVYFKRSLKPIITIIGWHRAEMKDEFQKYNYNYLSAINLDHFEILADGKCKNPLDILEFQKKGGVISLAQSKGCDVHLTIRSSDETVVRDFLRNRTAQKNFFTEIDSLISRNKLKGINIYFDCPMSPVAFIAFITDLKQNFKNRNAEILLNITIPAFINDENDDKLASYHFWELNPLVDYFIVATDNLIPQHPPFAQAMSPLLKNDLFRNRTIESTFAYYRNTEVPISKFILSVSYSGVVWEVDDFTGKLFRDIKEILPYSGIRDIYLNQASNYYQTTEGFDPDQATPFLNVLAADTIFKEQIWFEDSRSLFLKYNWALENDLGGVSINDLGNDKNDPEFWNALGASLIRIDTTYIQEPVQIAGFDRFWTIFTNALGGFHRKTFWQDLKWAGAVRLKYNAEDTLTGYRRFDSKNPFVGSVKDTISVYILNKVIWDEVIPFEIDSTRNGEAYQKNKSYCYSLYTRWTIYAEFFFWAGITLAIFGALLFLISFYLERYLYGGKQLRNIIHNLPTILIIFTFIFLCIWLYFDPSIISIGAGSEDGTNSLIMIYILVLGLFLGWFGANNYYKYKRD